MAKKKEITLTFGNWEEILGHTCISSRFHH